MSRLNITHVRIDDEETCILLLLDNGFRWLYYQEGERIICERQKCVERKGKQYEHEIVTTGSSMMGFTWKSLVALYQAHPMNWQNKVAPRMMQLYAEKRATEQLISA